MKNFSQTQLNIVLNKLKNNKQITEDSIIENETPVYRYLEKIGIVKCQSYESKSIFVVTRKDKEFFEYIENTVLK